MVKQSYQIRLPAIHDSLPRFYDFFNEVSQALGLSSQTHFDIELSIEEALTNVINHAYKNKDGDFLLSLECNNNQVFISIQDWGEPFDPSKVRPFDYNAPVEMRINGGMGLHFMRTLMDHIDYQFVDGSTILQMSKILPQSGESPQFEEQIEHELQVFDAVARALSTERNVNALLDLIIDKLTEVINADRGTLYLLDKEKGQLVSQVLQDTTGRLTEIRLELGQGIAGHVAQTGKTVNIRSVAEDPHFANYFDHISGYQTESMLCTPMLNNEGQIVGVVQLLNKYGGGFTRRDETIVSVLASQAAIAIENARLISSEREKRHMADTLREVSAILNSTLELEEVLQLILREVERVVPFNLASVLLIEGDELVVRASRGLRTEFAYSVPLFRLQDSALMLEMMQKRLPIILPDVRQDPRWVAIGKTQDIRSFLGTPLIVGDKVIGELSLNSTTTDFYRESHAEMVRTFANQAAAAIEKARLHQQTILQARLQQEVETARTIQASFLPDTEPKIDAWGISANWQPAKEVAGDFYDFIQLPDHKLGFVMADVCGKGIPASLFMALSRTVFRVMAINCADLNDIDPAKLLEKVNNQIKAESSSNLFVTLFYGILDPLTGIIHYCNGGHNPPVFARKDGTYELIDSNGPALGIFPNVPYTSGIIEMQAGDVLAIYTDGATEALNPAGEDFTEERLIECVTENQHKSAEEINAAIRLAVRNFCRERPPDDDTTLLVIKRL